MRFERRSTVLNLSVAAVLSSSMFGCSADDPVAPPPPPPLQQWAASFGGTASDVGVDIAVDGSGSVVVTGSFQQTVDFGGGPIVSAGSLDIFVTKFDASGKHVWSRKLGDLSTDQGNGVAVDGSGNVAMTGAFGGTVDFGGGPLTSAGSLDIFLVKLDARGNHVWSRAFGSIQADRAAEVAMDGSGNVLVTGGFEGTVDFGGGPLTSAGGDDIFVAKFGASGNHVWSQRFGSSSDDDGIAIAAGPAGAVAVTGSFFETVDFGGGVLTGAGTDDIFVVTFDASGNHVRSQRFGGTGVDQGIGIAVGSGGNVLVTGDFSSTVNFGGGPLTSAGFTDVFAAKFDASGNHVWSRKFGDSGGDTGRAVAVDGSGNAIITGTFVGTVNFGGGPLIGGGFFDIFVAKFNAVGSHVYSTRFGAQGNDVGYSVDVDGSGNVFATGSFGFTVDFAGEVLTSFGGTDLYVVKTGPNGPK